MAKLFFILQPVHRDLYGTVDGDKARAEADKGREVYVVEAVPLDEPAASPPPTVEKKPK